MDTRYEEYKEVRPIWSWILLALFAVALLGWGVFNRSLISERQRSWNYGTMPDTPGESEYSTNPPTRMQQPPLQMEALPETPDTARSLQGGTK